MKVSPKVMLMSVSLGAMLINAGCGKNDGDMKQSVQPLSMKSSSVQLSSMKSSSKQTVTSLQQVQAKIPGLSFDKGITRVKLGNSTQTVSVSNQYGAINIRQGQVKAIEIQTTVVVDHAEKKEAIAVANKTALQVTEGAHLDIKTHSEPYGEGKQLNPKVYLTITLPQGIKPDLKINQQNGELSMSSVTGTGKINMSVSNGNITATDIGGELSLQTTNGTIRVSNVKKSVRASVTNGNVQADHISGPMDIETKNGNLSSKGAVSSIRAVTVTGNINIETEKVGGNWNVSSTVGDVYLTWPERADVEVDGRTLFGKIRTDFPLVIKGKSVSGKVGDGTYHIRADSNAGLSFMKTS